MTEFSEDNLIPLLEKLAKEKKETILMGNFNINILNCDSDRDPSSLIDTIYPNFFYLTITIPIQIKSTSKALTDNILYNNITKSISKKNIATSISDHLTQYIFIPNEIFDKPTTKKIFRRKYITENLKTNQNALDKIDWRRTLAIGNKDEIKLFQIFLQKNRKTA